MKTDREDAEVKCCGRLFQVRAAATGNAWLLLVSGHEYIRNQVAKWYGSGPKQY